MFGRLLSVRLFLAREALNSFGAGLAINVLAIYYVRQAHLDPLQLVIVGTVLESSYFLFEIPTGVIADTIGRKASVVAGARLSSAWRGSARRRPRSSPPSCCSRRCAAWARLSPAERRRLGSRARSVTT